MNYTDKIQHIPIFQIVREAAGPVEAYVVGGFVRDLVLKRPSKDIDIVCLGSGIELAKKTQALLDGKTSISVFKNFGTAQLKHRDFEVEFVGARRESYRANSRNPVVEDGTLEDDQNRRDFTINAMAIALNENTFGQLIDPFDGQADLRRKMIRTPLEPGVTFSDDPLRIMRGIRFAAQLAFDIHPDTFAAMQHNRDRLKIVSQERITEELNKIILAPTPSYGFKLMFHAGLLDLVLPELKELQGVDTIDGKKHKDNFYHTLQVLDNVAGQSDNLWLRWAALLHDIAKPKTKRFDPQHGWTFHGHEDAGARMVPDIFRRMKLPMNEKMKYVQKLVRLHLRPISLVSDQITDSALRRLLYEAGPAIDDLMALCRADVTSKNDEKVKRYLRNFDKVERKLQQVEERDQVKNFQPPVRGEQIMAYFNVPPSRVVGDIKDEIKDAILEGKISNNFDEAFALMKALGSKKGLIQHEHKT
jgi:putative nucleotidyltransferase with HDIG domain